MKQILVIIEQAEGNFSAYSPDVLGCASTGDTIEQTVKNMREALELHLDHSEDVECHSLDWHLAQGLEISDSDFITHVKIEFLATAA
jgi:predicted RNase H-like HicB family nuclease